MYMHAMFIILILHNYYIYINKCFYNISFSKYRKYFGNNNIIILYYVLYIYIYIYIYKSPNDIFFYKILEKFILRTISNE